MRVGLVGAAVAAAIVAGLSAVAAQPLSPDPQRDSAPATASNTTMPVPMDSSTETMDAERAGRTSEPAPVSLEKPIDPSTYLCGPGDVFELNFWGKQNFRLQIAADLEGNAFISKIGFVNVSGKSLAAVRTLVKKRVQREYPGLGFELTLTRPRTFLVHIVDNVKTPGMFPSSAVERVSVVLSRAGGATGSRRRISIKRASGADLTADLVLYELTGDTTYNPYVLDGDVIRVPYPEVTVTIAGPVEHPGVYELVKTKDLAELLQLAGGIRSSAARTLPIRIVRRNEKQQERFVDLPFGSGGAAPNAALQDDDQIHVQDASELSRTVLLIGAVVGADPLDQSTTSKRLPFVEGDTVKSLIERAGGIRAPGDLGRSFLSRPQKNGDPVIIPIDLDALFVQRDFSADREIQMGDTIVVPPMLHAVLVEGAVGRPGSYNFNPRFGVSEYVARAGGRTRTAQDEDDIKIVDANGKSRAHKRGMKLQPGDSILVPERTFTRPEIVQLVIAGAGLVLSGVALTIAATR